MDVEVEDNVGINESGRIQQSSNNRFHHKNGNEIQIIDLASDSAQSNEEHEGDEVNLPGIEYDSEDSRILCKTDLLKSLSDIDNIVIKDGPSTGSSGGMLMQTISKSSSQNGSEDFSTSTSKEIITSTNGKRSLEIVHENEINVPR